jgi:hypothetical protein
MRGGRRGGGQVFLLGLGLKKVTELNIPNIAVIILKVFFPVSRLYWFGRNGHI